ncbi:MAG TPA: DUF1735 domain-containing protein [Mucilaginibacter sp.]|nr:DUF1735 domain-containing protein [Mucilaginibacter sp.]
MKRNYLIKNMGRICLAAGLLLTTLLSSCLKDTSPGSINFGNSPALVGWQYAGFTPTPYVGSVYGKPSDTVLMQVTLSVASLTLSNPVTLTIAPDPSYVASYNTANGLTGAAAYSQLNAADYTMPGGGTFIIKPGQQIVNFVLRIAGQNVDFTKQNAIGLIISSASGAVVATNLNEAIVLLKLKSVYAGTYAVNSGATTRYFGATVGSGLRDVFPIAESTISYNTVSPNSVNGQVGSSSFGLTGLINFNGTVVTVTADPAGTVGSNTFNYVQGDSKGAASSYDPSTKVLIVHISYLNGAGALREIDMNLTGPQ